MATSQHPAPDDPGRRGPDPDATLSDAHGQQVTVAALTPHPSSPPASGDASALVRPGSDLGTRYHIERALGEGGMGSVYRAYDRELDRLVAIKVIRPGLVSEPAAVQRFKQELLLGSRVSHKHILRIHDLGDVGGLKFISMAYVDGEDLHGLLRRTGRLPVPRAVAIARQIADALAAAHAEGVVHRDLKPHNILVDRADTAYVSDFGLAKSLLHAAAAGVTRSGELLGTPRYMAPEQVEGGPVDHRVDLYAFGLILYEMVTGTTPFRGDSAIQELLERVRNRPPDPRSVNADVPAPLADIILRCLERDPTARFQTAGEILAALGGPATDGVSGPVFLTGGTRGRWSQVVRFRDRRWLATAGAALLLAAAVAGGAMILRRAPDAPTAAVPPRAAVAPPGTAAAAGAQRQIAVLPFRVLGDEDQLGYVAQGVVEALSSKLFQTAALRVVSNRDVEQVGAGASMRDVAHALGATLVVEGTLQRAGDRLRLVVNLHDVPANRRVWSNQFTGTFADIFALEDQIHEQLTAALFPDDAVVARARSATRPTDNLDAYDLYLKGRNALRSSQDPAQVQSAVDLFGRAIKHDPRFALAYTGLADASLLMYKETRNSLWAERARASAMRARDLDAKLPEVYFSLGAVYTDTGQHAEAVVVLKQALDLAPESGEAYRRLGNAYRGLGRKDDALAALRKAVEINPYFWVNRNTLGAAYLHFGQPDDALEEFRRVAELEPDNPIGYDNMGSVHFSQGRWEACIPAYQRALELQPHWLTYSNLGTAYFYLKRYADAVRVFEQAAALNPNDAITHGNLADALRWSGDRDRAAATYARAIRLAYRDLQVNSRDATTLAMVGLYQSKRGNHGSAAEFIRKARSIEPRNASLLYYEAVAECLAGRDKQALAALEKALAGGYPAREAAEDPELASLSGSPAFERLMGRFGSTN